jgi:predicted alpha/beta-fold hydrolase
MPPQRPTTASRFAGARRLEQADVKSEPGREFLPARWLRSPHLQSILSSLPLRRPRVERRAAPLLERSRELLLDCGDGVTLQAFHAQPAVPNGRLVVLLHGWEGSASSLYILSLGQSLLDAGFEVLRLNLRDHGDTHHLNRELFHSCRIEELMGALREVQRLAAGRPLELVGFSLGGNFLLRATALAGQPGPDASLRIARVIAISPVLDPAVTLTALERGLFVYRRYFVTKWSRSLLRKQRAWPQHYDFAPLLRKPELRHMTAELVSHHTGYPHIDDYLAGYAITGDRLATLSAPAVILAASDDPIIPPRDLQRLANSAHLRIVQTRFGGHTGFVSGWKQESWTNDFVLRELGTAHA